NHNVLIKNCIGTPCVSLQHHYEFNQVSSLDDGLKEKPDVVFITNPSSKHLDVALKAARYGCNLFIEKPLSHTLRGVDLLSQTADSKNLIVTIGYQTRFHPCYKFIVQTVSEKKYGDVVSASFEWGTYLPCHHPYEDYRKGYAAKKSLGGGVILGLSHEIDMICSIWGQPEELFAVGGKLSPLEMDAEDTVSVLMGFKRGSIIFPVTLFLSYAQAKEVRKFRIQLENALILSDLSNNRVRLFDNKGEIITQKDFPDLKRNDLFMEEMKEFISAVKNRRQSLISLNDGIETLKLAMRIKEAIDG
ncbi:Gfo/Idh/MocA family oxidoreductase, partial [bacterium]|nr:Gfo/Idh/MocA family oxidoreductase [bacterium]